MATHANTSASTKTASPRERNAAAVAPVRRSAASAVPRVSPRAASCACGGHCPKCLRSTATTAPLPISEDAAAEQEAEQIAQLLLGGFFGSAPVPPPENNSGGASSSHLPRRLAPTVAPLPSLGSGQPLPEVVRRRLEPVLGFDLSALRLHNDDAAHALARQHHARAFTFGSHLVFGAGEYSPQRAGGLNIIAHEIVHAVQQCPRGPARAAQRTNRHPLEAQRAPAHASSSARNASFSAPARHPWASGTLSHHARPRGPPSARAPPVTVQHHFAQPRVQCVSWPSWDDVSNAVVDTGAAALDTAVDVGSSAVGVAVDIGEGAIELGTEVVERTADFFIGLIDDYAPGLLEFLRGGFMSRLTDLFCRGLDAVIGGLISSLENIDFVSALEAAFASAQGGVESVIGAIQSGASSALGSLMQPVVEALDEYGPGIIEAITGASDSVNGFFDSIWESLGAPALDFLGEAGGAVWQEISDMITWLWDATSDVRAAAADAWDWVMGQFDIAWDSTSGIRDWLSDKATEAWESMKEALGPLEGPITVLLGVLLILSPLGPIIIATQVIPPLWEKLTWLWNNWNTDDILVWAQDTLRENILPGIINAVSGVASAIANAASWIAGVTVQVADAFGGVLGIFGGNACLATVTRVLTAVSTQFTRLAAWAEGGFTGLADAVSNVFNSIIAILQPILDFLMRLVLVVTNPPMLPIALTGAIWLLIPDKLKPPVINFILDLIIAFLSGFPAFLTGLGPLAAILKAGTLGFLRGLRDQDDKRKVDATNKIANLMTGGGLQFIAGFAVGILEGLLDGILDPFRLIWMLIQFLARICGAIGNYLAPLVMEGVPPIGAAVAGFNATVRASIPATPPARAPAPEAGGSTETLERGSAGAAAGPTAAAPPAGETTVNPEDAAFADIMSGGPTASDASIAASLPAGLSGELSSSAGDLDATAAEGETSALAEIQSEGSSVSGLSGLLGGIWNTIIEGATSLGTSAANALINFILLPDYELGNKIGYVAGLVLLEVIVAYFSGGVSVELKAAEPFIKAAIRFLDLGGEILGLLGRAVRPIKGPLLRGLSAAGEHLGRFRFLQPILARIRRAANTLFHFGDEAVDAASHARAGGRADDLADAASAGRRADDAADAAGAGRRADDAADASRHADEAGDAARKTAELPVAMAAAEAICAANDRIEPSPPPVVVHAQLNATLRPRFRWIEGFFSVLKEPGVYEIHMQASDHVVKRRYTAGARERRRDRMREDMTPDERRTADVAEIFDEGASLGRNPNSGRGAASDAFERDMLDSRGVGPADTRRTGTARPPRHHVLPQEHIDFFQARGFNGRDIDNFTLELDEAVHQAIHGGGNWRMGRTWSGEWNQALMTRLRELEGRLGRNLTREEILSATQGLMRRYHLPRRFIPFNAPRGRRLANGPAPGRTPASVGTVLASPGRRLSPRVRAQMEMDLGTSFSDVRVHTGPMAETAAQETRSEAFAVGSHLVFGRKHPDPERTTSQAVLAHELVHVRQHRSTQKTVAPVVSDICFDPDPAAEHEATRVADAVVSARKLPRISASSRPVAGSAVASPTPGPSIQTALASSAPRSQTLAATTRLRMENHFGRDFSQVRIHTDDNSANLNHHARSQALATGRDIYFSAGRYRPGTHAGDRLIAHELTHVVQQVPAVAPPVGSRKSNFVAPSLAASRGRARMIQRSPEKPEEIQSYVFAGDPKLKTDVEYARRRGRDIGDKIRQNNGLLAHVDRLELKAMVDFFQLAAKEAYVGEVRQAVNDVATEIEMPAENIGLQSYVFAGDRTLATATWFAQRRGREIAARIRKDGGRASKDDALERNGMLAFFQGEAREVYRKQIESYSRPIEPRFAHLIRDMVEELDRDSPRDKALTSLAANGLKWDAKQWALELEAVHHHRSGNYLLRFFEVAASRGILDQLFGTGVAKGKAAEGFKRLLAKQGIMVDELSLEWELHLQMIEQQSASRKIDLRNYPVYTWKTALGSQLEPFIEVLNFALHLIPVFGQALGGLEALVGQEILTGRKLAGWERLLGFLPYAGTIVKAGKNGARALMVLARSTGVKPDALYRLMVNSTRIASEAEQLREIQKLVARGGAISAQQKSLLSRTRAMLKPLEGEMEVAAAAGRADPSVPAVPDSPVIPATKGGTKIKDSKVIAIDPPVKPNKAPKNFEQPDGRTKVTASDKKAQSYKGGAKRKSPDKKTNIREQDEVSAGGGKGRKDPDKGKKSSSRDADRSGPSTEMRGEQLDDPAKNIRIRSSTGPAKVAYEEVAALRNTEKAILKRQAKLLKEKRQADDVARSLGDQVDHITEKAKNKSRLPQAEDALKAQEERVKDLEKKIAEADDELAHVRSRLELPRNVSGRAPPIAMGDVKSMDSYNQGLREVSAMEGKVGYNGNVGIAMYDPKTGDVVLQVFGPRAAGQPRRIIFEEPIGRVRIPAGRTPVQIGNEVEEAVRDLARKATGQPFPGKSPHAHGPDLLPP